MRKTESRLAMMTSEISGEQQEDSKNESTQESLESGEGNHLLKRYLRCRGEVTGMGWDLSTHEFSSSRYDLLDCKCSSFPSMESSQ